MCMCDVSWCTHLILVCVCIVCDQRVVMYTPNTRTHSMYTPNTHSRDVTQCTHNAHTHNEHTQHIHTRWCTRTHTQRTHIIITPNTDTHDHTIHTPDHAHYMYQRSTHITHTPNTDTHAHHTRYTHMRAACVAPYMCAMCTAHTHQHTKHTQIRARVTHTH